MPGDPQSPSPRKVPICRDGYFVLVRKRVYIDRGGIEKGPDAPPRTSSPSEAQLLFDREPRLGHSRKASWVLAAIPGQAGGAGYPRMNHSGTRADSTRRASVS
jgi:hypothetical protein